MIKDDFIKLIESKSLEELKQEYAVLDSKIIELRAQKEYVGNIIKASVDLGELQIAINDLPTKEKIKLLISRGKDNKWIHNFLPDTTESYIRQVRSEYLGSEIRKRLYKAANSKAGLEQKLQLAALDLYHGLNREAIKKQFKKLNLEVDDTILLFCETVYRGYKNPTMISLPDTESAQNTKNYLVKYLLDVDAHYNKNNSQKINKENETRLRNVVETLMLYIGKSNQKELKRVKSNLSQQMGLTDSYIDRVTSVLQSLYDNKYTITTPVHLEHLIANIKEKSKLPLSAVNKIAKYSGIYDPQLFIFLANKADLIS